MLWRTSGWRCSPASWRAARGQTLASRRQHATPPRGRRRGGPRRRSAPVWPRRWGWGGGLPRRAARQAPRPRRCHGGWAAPSKGAWPGLWGLVGGAARRQGEKHGEVSPTARSPRASSPARSRTEWYGTEWQVKSQKTHWSVLSRPVPRGRPFGLGPTFLRISPYTITGPRNLSVGFTPRENFLLSKLIANMIIRCNRIYKLF